MCLGCFCFIDKIATYMPWKERRSLFCDFLWWLPGRTFDVNGVKVIDPPLGGDEKVMKRV